MNLEMFQNRTSSKKPSNELIASFRASFPQLTAASRMKAALSQNTTSALDLALCHAEDLNDQDSTLTWFHKQGCLKPSLLEPNSLAFASFANQPSCYYNPTPGGTSILYHSQAGDLHTTVETPLLMPSTKNAVPAAQNLGAMYGFQPYAFALPPSQNLDFFAAHPQMTQSQPFVPHDFTDQWVTFESMNQTEEKPPSGSIPVDVEMQEWISALDFAQGHGDQFRTNSIQEISGNFHWHVTLNAPTAMIKHAEEVPVTYLNKGQAYSIVIVETAPAPQIRIPATYRTYIRIFDEDEQRRQNPGACWQLWKEGRGMDEAHKRGGRVQAVEFVEPTQVRSGGGWARPTVELESASFDGFAITWTPAANCAVECAISVRFNFLTTDFSHLKGVKAIPVRLCAKTTQLDTSFPESPKPEICYCKVMLFRDHGAERKLSNDITHVNKAIDKLKEQIAQVGSGMKILGKRKQSSAAKPGSSDNSRPAKVPKHKHTWSMSSTKPVGNIIPSEECLYLKLAALQDTLTSARPTSVLDLKGEELDDPDLHPVQLSGQHPDLTATDAGDPIIREKRSAHDSSTTSPNQRSQPTQSIERRGSTFQSFSPLSGMSPREWHKMPQKATSSANPCAAQPTDSKIPSRIQKISEDGTLDGWIDVIGVDHSYQPPPKHSTKPVACFYIQPSFVGTTPEDNYYRAVYLTQYTVENLLNGIAMKCDIEPLRVTRIIRINKEAKKVLLNDGIVQEIPEGQDIIAEFQEIDTEYPVKYERGSGLMGDHVDEDIGAIETAFTSIYELRLRY